MSLYNIVRPDLLVSGQPEDISQVLANFQAIQTVLNGNLEDVNMKALGISNPSLAAGILASKLAGYPADATKFLAGDGTWKVAGGAPFKKTTPKDVANTVTETDLLNGEFALGAGLIGTSGILRLTAWGDHELNGSANAPQWRLKLGATTLVDTGSFGWQALGTNRTGWKLVAEIMNLGATNIQRVNFLLVGAADYVGNGVANNARLGGFVTGDGAYQLWGNMTSGSKGAQYMAQGGNAGAVDMTASQVLALTVTNPAALATYDVKLIGAMLEVI